MKFEKEIKINRIASTNNIIIENSYTEIEIEGALSNKELENIFNNFAHKKIKLTLEIEDPILDETERKYLSDVIRPFRNDVTKIYKSAYKKESIYIGLKDDVPIMLPCLKKGTMYKGMKLYMEYSLEELGL